jgi:predicted dehydrogenase
MNDLSTREAGGITRREFVGWAGAAVAAMGLSRVPCAQGAEPPPAPVDAQGNVIPGFEKTQADLNAAKGWQPVSDRKVRVGIAGYGFCQFGAAFSFQNHPNVEVVAVTDLMPERCAGLAKACRCEKTYPSCEEMIKDDRIEAVFVATDAPSHARLCLEALKRGKHVATAVPAVFGLSGIEEAGQLLDAVKQSGKTYMMFETSCFHEDLHGWRQQYRAGALGKVMYAEGEYYHFSASHLPSYNGWRNGLPPQFYPTHSNAYYVGVTGGSFTEVSCMAMPSVLEAFQPQNNPYQNPFGTEIALFRTSEGGMARMAVSWDSRGPGGEQGRIRTQKEDKVAVDTNRPPLPPGVAPGGHGGSHGYLMSEFVESILQDRTPMVSVADALNMTVAGIVAHRSALKDGELLKIPQYRL